MEHAKGKLLISSSFLIVDKDAMIVANTQPLGVDALDFSYKEAIANTERLVKCWNEHDRLTNALTKEHLLRLDTETQKADLLAACKASLAWLQDAPMSELEAIEEATEKSTPKSLLQAVIAQADS